MSNALRTAWDANDLDSVRNDTVGALTKGLIVKRGTVQDGVILPAAVTDSCYGVIRETTVASGEFGTAQLRGKALVKAGGAIAVGDDIMPTTAGKGVLAAGAGGALVALIGKANSVAVLDELFECELAGPDSFKQFA